MVSEICTLLILVLLETILCIDNVIFISLAVDKVSKSLRKLVRVIGLMLALLMRFIMLFFTSSILSMQRPVFYILSLGISVKDLLMITGGSFLIYKSFVELMNGHAKNRKKISIKSQFFLATLQIICIDLVFSIDSILTAIALTHNIILISVAFTFSVLQMLFLSYYITKLIKSYPRLKIITLLFILFVGVYLILDGLHIELKREYLYSSFVFALLVEIINRVKKRHFMKVRKRV